MFKLKFINHSSVNLSNNHTSLTIDPWIEGAVFNDSWNLICKTPIESINAVKNSDFIWFSHEHPDHFSISFFNKFGETIKENLKFKN